MNDEFYPVHDSSWITALVYDPGCMGGYLEIHQRDGYPLRYGDVPRGVLEAMLDAPSKGEYYNGYIRGIYSYLG